MTWRTCCTGPAIVGARRCDRRAKRPRHGCTRGYSRSRRQSMKIVSNGSALVALGIALAAGIAVGIGMNLPTAAQGPPAATSGRYRVVETDGMSLIVTDNQKNMLY